MRLLEGVGWTYARKGAYAGHTFGFSSPRSVTPLAYTQIPGLDLVLRPERPGYGAGAHPSTPTTEYYELEVGMLAQRVDIRATLYVVSDGDELGAAAATLELAASSVEAETRGLVRLAVPEDAWVYVRFEERDPGTGPGALFALWVCEPVLVSPYGLGLLAHANEYLGPYADTAPVTDLDDGDSGAGALTNPGGGAPTRDADGVGAGVDALVFSGSALERLVHPTPADLTSQTSVVMGVLVDAVGAAAQTIMEISDDALGTTVSARFDFDGAGNVSARVETDAGTRSLSLAWPGAGWRSIWLSWVSGEGVRLYVGGELVGESTALGGTLLGSSQVVSLGAGSVGALPLTGSLALPVAAVGDGLGDREIVGLMAFTRHMTGI